MPNQNDQAFIDQANKIVEALKDVYNAIYNISLTLLSGLNEAISDYIVTQDGKLSSQTLQHGLNDAAQIDKLFAHFIMTPATPLYMMKVNVELGYNTTSDETFREEISSSCDHWQRMLDTAKYLLECAQTEDTEALLNSKQLLEGAMMEIESLKEMFASPGCPTA
jgi:hypothetical protein